MQIHLTPSRAGHPRALTVVLTALLAGLLLAQPVLADADADSAADSESSAESVSDASDEAADSETTSEEEEESTASESRTMEILNKTFDVVVLRPPQAVMAGLGVIAFVPAAILASPGGRDSIEEALDRFVIIPVEYAFQRPLGEF